MGEQGDQERRQPGLASHDGYRYAIWVQGHLDFQWSEWLEGMTITHEESGETRLEGAIVDQAALHGLLNKLRDLCLPVLAVQRLGAAVPETRGSEEPPMEFGRSFADRDAGRRREGAKEDETDVLVAPSSSVRSESQSLAGQRSEAMPGHKEAR